MNFSWTIFKALQDYLWNIRRKQYVIKWLLLLVLQFIECEYDLFAVNGCTWNLALLSQFVKFYFGHVYGEQRPITDVQLRVY